MQRKKMLLIVNTLIIFIGINITFGQPYRSERTINWQIIKNYDNSEKEFEKIFSFDGALRDKVHSVLPVFYEQIKLDYAGKVKAALKNPVYAAAEADSDFTRLGQYLGNEISLSSSIRYGSKVPYALVQFIPLRKNAETGKIEKLISFSIEVEIEKESLQRTDAGSLSKKGAKGSLLANGDWYKIGVTETGIYKIDHGFLKQLGINPSGIDPRNIRIYGKPGGMLPEPNSVPRDTDLVENAIKIIGEEDGVFNSGDYILFYGQGQTTWTLNKKTNQFNHQINHYADTSYYFITVSSERGKRISTQASENANATKVIRSYDNFAFHEINQWTEVTKNVKSGREWYGEEFNNVTSYNINIKIPNVDPSSKALLRSFVAARSGIKSTFSLTVNNSEQFTQTVRALSLAPDNYRYIFNQEDTFLIAAASSTDIQIKYNRLPNTIGFLNFLEINARSFLSFHAGQFSFRDAKAIAAGGINEYRIQNAPGHTEVWDVTDFHNVKMQSSSFNNGELTFKATSDKLREFLAFDGSRFLQATAFGRIPNQDLRSLSAIDMVIISHPSFYPAAQRLANFHKERDGLRVQVVSPQLIYNEFSSAAQDVTAIRDFMKMLYNNAPTKEEAPKYLLLFGDASYDFKNRVKDNSNFVPTYQSYLSDDALLSYCADDYFGLLDMDEGWMQMDELLDLGIGRLPVQNLAQANIAIDKIIRYHQPQTMQDWRNVLTFVSDDEDYNAFIDNSEGFTSYLEGKYPFLNMDKIYLDAYKQLSTPAGQKYPDAMDAINKRISTGTLVFTYYGHGGEQGLAHERVIDIDMINGWTNMYRMPLFITGTCELSRFDDPVRTSAGELCVLNPKGGAIASISTTRVVTITGNEALGFNIFDDNIFNTENGDIPRLGDVLRIAKNRTGLGTNTLNFTLLGDPALQLALPKHQVITTEINNRPLNANENDTLKALSYITIKGIVADRKGNKINSYNGIIYPTVYDKPQNIKTLKNDPSSMETVFQVRNSIIYKGKASVKNGEFVFAFVVPKDISYQNAIGKISYYAENGKEDANGANQRLVIGGTSDNMITDDKGPEIKLFINDTNFVLGGLVDDTPVLIAKIRDDIGINTVGNGIGHELTGVLNNGEPIILNNYYAANLDDYTSGEIRYQFSQLPDGNYNLKVKVWDVANNSSEAFTEFVVASPSNLTLKRVFNYPNPFSDRTTFSFEHNLPDEDLTIEINIYDIRGALLKTINASQSGNSSRINNIEWDGRDNTGGPMATGVYVYRLIVKNAEGKTAHQSQRLVIVR